MVTVGGAIMGGENHERFSREGGVRGESFLGDDWPVELVVPSLTLREVRFLTKYPEGKTAEVHEVVDPGIPGKAVEQFRKVYRYYPAFSETELL